MGYDFTKTNYQGRPIIAVEPASTGLRRSDGERVYLKRTVLLQMAGGDVAYGCTECGFADDSVGKVNNHVANAHGGTTGPKQPKTAKRRDAAVISHLKAALSALEETPDESSEVEKWKKRALDAERRLAMLRKALGTD